MAGVLWRIQLLQVDQRQSRARFLYRSLVEAFDSVRYRPSKIVEALIVETFVMREIDAAALNMSVGSIGERC